MVPNNLPKKENNHRLQTDHPCLFCGVYGHYTHHCPLTPKYFHLWEEETNHEFVNASQSQAIPHPTSNPPSQPMVLQNPFHS
jgi:hypothetical protein